VDQLRNTSKDPLHVPNAPMTRSKIKALKEALNALVFEVFNEVRIKRFIGVSRALFILATQGKMGWCYLMTD
jgi:hypothetical protein